MQGALISHKIFYKEREGKITPKMASETIAFFLGLAVRAQVYWPKQISPNNLI